VWSLFCFFVQTARIFRARLSDRRRSERRIRQNPQKLHPESILAFGFCSTLPLDKGSTLWYPVYGDGILAISNVPLTSTVQTGWYPHYRARHHERDVEHSDLNRSECSFVFSRRSSDIRSLSLRLQADVRPR